MSGLAYQGAAHNRLFLDFEPQLLDPNDEWWHDAPTLAARSWQLWRDDPYFRALVETSVEAVVGYSGLNFKSLYQEDDRPDTTDREKQVRRDIDSCIRRATAHTRLDAAGQLSYMEMTEATRRSAKVTGDGYAVRTWKPNRPRAYQATAWRLIDSARVSNPNHAPNSERLFEGHELDADGATIAIHVQRTHPNLTRYAPEFRWVRVPMFAPDGSRNVVHVRNGSRADQIRGIGMGAPMLLYLRLLQTTTESWALAKRVAAAYAAVIETEDPEAAAKADRYGAKLTGNVPLKPAMRYYHNHRKVEFTPWRFDGQDYENYRNPLVEAVSAAEGIPYEFVLRRLTKSNLASSRAAMGVFYNYGRREQNKQIPQCELWWIESILREDIARGRLTVGSDDWDEILRGRWLRPPRVMTDPSREADAAEKWVRMGRSYTNIFDEAGLDFETEAMQLGQDRAFLEAQGIDLTPQAVAGRFGAVAEAVPADDQDADDEDDEDEDEKKSKTKRKPGNHSDE